MTNEEALEKIKSAVISIEGKDYIKVKKDTFKRLGYRYNIFTKLWKKTKFSGMISSLKIKAIKQDKNTYLVEMDLNELNKSLAGWFITPHLVELVA